MSLGIVVVVGGGGSGSVLVAVEVVVVEVVVDGVAFAAVCAVSRYWASLVVTGA